MITDPRYFDDAHVPRELPHRHTELQSLDRALDPGRDGAGVDDVLIAGPSGVGKTALARHYLTRAAEHDDVQWTRVECLGETTGTILRDTLEGLTNQDVPRNTTTEKARDGLAGLEERSVVILDEADDLPETDVFDHLTGLPKLSLIVVCHDRDRWVSRLDEAHQSRFRSVIQPDRYDVDELADILRPRARQGLVDDVVDEPQLRELADGAAGVARRGIQSLRAAAELAGERGHTQITDADIEDSFERARERIREMNLQSLAFHHHVLYELIREAGEIRMQELNERYEARSDELYRDQPVTPISRRWRRDRLPKLVEYDLVTRQATSGGSWYRVVDDSLASPAGVLEVTP